MKRFIVASVLVVVLIFVLTGCKTEVSDQDYALKFNDTVYDGKYTGTMEDQKPEEKGKFICGEVGGEKYLIYDGSWKKGKMKGKGRLETNNYLVQLPDPGDGDDGKRIGSYSGEVKNGVAEGKGTFKTKNNKGVKYTYDGEWKDGLYDGKGKLVYAKKSSYIEEKKKKKGDFRPSLPDYIKTLGTNQRDCPYSLSDKEMNFIKKNEKVFLTHNKNKAEKLVKGDFSVSNYKKTEKTKSKVVKVSGLEAYQVLEEDSFGYKNTFVLADSDSGTPYYLHYIGHSKKIQEGNTFSAIIMPHAYSTYKTIENDKVWAIAGTILALY